jgi:hypothetical protein
MSLLPARHRHRRSGRTRLEKKSLDQKSHALAQADC